MTDTVYTPQQIKTILQPVFADYNVKKAVLFGSYAKGLADKKSDVDILVDSGLKGLSFVELLEEVSQSLNKDVDLFDITHIIPHSLIESEINKDGVLIYGE